MENQITPTSPAQAPATVDAHGFDPNDYRWVPVLRKPRADGWSPEKQRRFIEALADCGSVAAAVREVGMSETSAYKLRRSPGAQGFDMAWAAATEASAKRLLDEAFERALVGSDEPVFNREGVRVGRKYRKSDRMLQFLLRGYFPERFAGQMGGGVPATSPAANTPVAEALARLIPEPIEEPHKLLAPDELDDAIFVAQQLDGRLPGWCGDREPVSAPPCTKELDRVLRDILRVDAGLAPLHMDDDADDADDDDADDNEQT